MHALSVASHVSRRDYAFDVCSTIAHSLVLFTFCLVAFLVAGMPSAMCLLPKLPPSDVSDIATSRTSELTMLRLQHSCIANAAHTALLQLAKALHALLKQKVPSTLLGVTG